MAVEIDLTVPQTEFRNLTCRYPLFVGGYGSGKSFALILSVLEDMKNYPGATHGIYSPTYDLLSLNLIPRFEDYFSALGLRYHYLRSKNVMTIPGLGKLIFRSMDNPARIVAYECFRSHVDELDLLDPDKAEEVWNRIIARNRQRLSGDPPNRVSGYSTPEGFAFTYKRWGKEPGEEYQYVRAPTHSNPHLQADYVESLRKTYSPRLVEAYLHGYWVNLTSGACFPEFDRKENGCETVEDGQEGLIVGQDFNITRQCSVIYVRRDNGLHAVDEIHNAFDTEQMLTILRERYANRQITVIPDASGNARSSKSGSVSDFTLIRAAKLRIDAPSRNPLVRNRINATNALILNGVGLRSLKVNTCRCPEFTAAMEQITFDKNGVMDKKHGLDDIVDSGTYPIHRLFPVEHYGEAMIKLVGG